MSVNSYIWVIVDSVSIDCLFFFFLNYGPHFFLLRHVSSHFLMYAEHHRWYIVGNALKSTESCSGRQLLIGTVLVLPNLALHFFGCIILVINLVQGLALTLGRDL